MLRTRQLCQQGIYQALHFRPSCPASQNLHTAFLRKNTTFLQWKNMCSRSVAISQNSKHINRKLCTVTISQTSHMLNATKANCLRTCGQRLYSMTLKKTNVALEYSNKVGCVRTIRTSSRHYVPPLLALLILKPMAKLGAVISGR